MSRSSEKIILNSAIVFKEKGFNASTVNDIASATGILKGSLYNHFTSKENILIAVIETVELGFLKYICDNNPSDFEKILEKMTSFFVEEQSCLMANLLAESIPIDAQEKVKGFFENWKNILIESMDNRINSEDKNIFAEDIIALFEGSVIIAKVSQKPDAIYRCLHTLLRKYNAIDKSISSQDTERKKPTDSYREISGNGNDDTLICDT